MPNFFDHYYHENVSDKKDSDSNENGDKTVVIGVILGRVDGKIIEISNCFPMSLKSDRDADGKKNEFSSKNQPSHSIDKDYLKKMIDFHKKINKTEAILGVYISSTKINQVELMVIQYFRDLFSNQEVRSPLSQPIFMLFDPTLTHNKLDIKILKMHSVYLEKLPMFSELPYKFNLDHVDATGLDVLFYGQEHCDTMSILSDKREHFSDDNLK